MKTKAGRLFRRALSSLMFLGYAPIAPGTVGSAVAVACMYLLWKKTPLIFAPPLHAFQWVGMVAVAAIAILACRRINEVFDDHDPPQVVIDEFAGQVLTFFMVPLSIRTLILGFFLFRFFDIVKPYPVYKAEEIEEGVGVAMDDIIAGVYANVSMFVILWSYEWIRGLLNA